MAHMPRGICPHERKPKFNRPFINVTGCDRARALNPVENPDGNCDHWIHAPSEPEGKDNPNMTGELLHGEGVGGAVNCYPGVPGFCHQVCYIFVEWVSNPWECLENQIMNCPNTQEIYIVGSWYSLQRHQMRGNKIKSWLKGVGMLRPALNYVGARESAVYPGGRIKHLYP
jgi:hypothetical protein